MYFENEERLAYLQARGKVILSACPGSGKTTTIAKKILNLETSNRSLILLKTKLMKHIES